jgi:hypothetical protein
MAIMLGGCDAEYADTDFGFRVVPPAGWGSVPASQVQVPGRVVHAWMSETGSNVVAFLQTPAQPATAEELLASSVEGIAQAGGTVISEEMIKIDGTDAVSIEFTAPGTGSALMQGGKVLTFQHCIAIPKQNRWLVLLATAPDSAKNETVTAFSAMIRSLKLD